MLGRKYHHNKNIYILVGEGKLRTETEEKPVWEEVMVYKNQDKPEELYVRKKADFESTFIPLIGMENLSPKEIFDGICTFFDITPDQVRSSHRHHKIGLARFSISTILYRIKKVVYKEIGQMQGGRDHSTILNHLKVHDNMMDTDPDYLLSFNTLCKYLDDIAKEKFKTEIQ